MVSLCHAIATEEGFFVEGSRPQRNNNPGDLMWGSESERFGAMHGDPRFAVFPNPSVGWFALRGWLSVPAKFEDGKLVAGYLGATLQQVIGRFAPDNENNTADYLTSVCTQTGLSPSTIVTANLFEDF